MAGPSSAWVVGQPAETERESVAHGWSQVTRRTGVFSLASSSTVALGTVTSLLPDGAEVVAGASVHAEVWDGAVAAGEGAGTREGDRHTVHPSNQPRTRRTSSTF
jgi:hypothetical protein